MNRGGYRRVRELFHRAATLDSSERGEFLERECRGDRELMAKVEDLLERDSRTSVVSGGLAGEADWLLETEGTPLPDGVGRYEVLDVLGRGGMGVVYRARQENPEREVALKVLRPVAFSPSLAKRFQREAQVLARLQHAGIAQVFEAGTADLGLGPQPWFAMELVDGVGLSRWAEGRSVREKLALVIRMCEAVHHAHARGVVHRDLKPDNVLVTADDRPKVLDFGVARVTDAGQDLTTVRTDVRHLIGTLPYMSPEQAQGESERIDARSDVYALGVVAYELLAGELPYELRDKPVAQAARVIVEEDPRPLSSVARVFRGDLETIVGKALEKEPERRYGSAEELAADLGRYLHHEPIRARPPTTWYQLRKLARRNRRLFLATSAAFVALLGGTTTSTVLAVRESRARTAALAQADRAEQIASFTVGVFAPQELGKSEPDPVAILAFALERAETQLADQPDMAGDLSYAIGNLYNSLGYPEDAERVFRRAVEAHRLCREAFPEKLVGSLEALGEAYRRRREYRGSAEVLAELVEHREGTLGPSHPLTVRTRFFHATTLGMAGELNRACEVLLELSTESPESMTIEEFNNLGSTLYRNGLFREAEGVLRPLVDDDAARSPNEIYNRAWAAFQLTALLCDVGRFREAERYSARMMELLEAFDLGELAMDTGFLTYMHGHVEHCLGRYVSAERLALEAMQEFRRLQADIAFPSRELGISLLGQGRLREAEGALEDYLAGQRTKTGDGEWYVGQAEALLARALRELGKLPEAEARGHTAVERTRRSLRAGHPRIADALEPLAETLVALGAYEEAAEVCREALVIRRGCMDEGAVPIASLELVLAQALHGKGDAAAAFALAEEALEDFLETYRPGHPERGRAYHVLASCAGAEVAAEVREGLWRTAVELRRDALRPGHPSTAESELELGCFLLEAGRREEAEPWIRGALLALEAAVDPCHPALAVARDSLASGERATAAAGRALARPR